MTITNKVSLKSVNGGNTPVADVVDAPTIGTATAGIGTASVTFTAATTGGSATSYGAISTPGSITGTSATSPITISGLTADTAYTFKTYGINSAGTWSNVLSAASNSVTVLGTAFEFISSVTGTGSASTLTFNSIPSTYKHLQIRGLSRDASGGNASGDLNVRFNSDTGSSSYWSHFAEAIGSSTVSNGVTNGNNNMRINRGTQGSAAAANYMGVSIIDIHDYSSTTKNKVVRAITGIEDNNTIYSTTDLISGLWISTSAINTIAIVNGMGNNFNTSTVFSLYGIKG